jgi:hypothetical protein
MPTHQLATYPVASAWVIRAGTSAWVATLSPAHRDQVKGWGCFWTMPPASAWDSERASFDVPPTVMHVADVVVDTRGRSLLSVG